MPSHVPPPPFRISPSVFLEWSHQKQINYLADAGQASAGRVERATNGTTTFVYYPTIRRIKVSKKEYNNKSDAYAEARRILTNVKSKAK